MTFDTIFSGLSLILVNGENYVTSIYWLVGSWRHHLGDAETINISHSRVYCNHFSHLAFKRLLSISRLLLKNLRQ